MKIFSNQEENLDEKILLRRKIPGLLSMEKAYLDGNGQYWYNISGKQSLDTYCNIQNVGIGQLILQRKAQCVKFGQRVEAFQPVQRQVILPHQRLKVNPRRIDALRPAMGIGVDNIIENLVP